MLQDLNYDVQPHLFKSSVLSYKACNLQGLSIYLLQQLVPAAFQTCYLSLHPLRSQRDKHNVQKQSVQSHGM